MVGIGIKPVCDIDIAIDDNPSRLGGMDLTGSNGGDIWKCAANGSGKLPCFYLWVDGQCVYDGANEAFGKQCEQIFFASNFVDNLWRECRFIDILSHCFFRNFVVEYDSVVDDNPSCHQDGI